MHFLNTSFYFNQVLSWWCKGFDSEVPDWASGSQQWKHCWLQQQKVLATGRSYETNEAWCQPVSCTSKTLFCQNVFFLKASSIFPSGAELFSGILRTAYPDLWLLFSGRTALFQSTAKTTPTCSSTCVALSAAYCQSVAQAMRSLLTRMVCGTCRTR